MTFGRQWMVAVLFFVCALGVPRESFAILGWIEQLSGPGPFPRATQWPVDRLVCVTDEGSVVTWFSGEMNGRVDCERDDPDGISGFLSFEFARGKSSENILFPDSMNEQHQVTLLSYKGVGYYRVHSSVDAGIGIGLNRFSGEDFDTFYRVSVPLRLRFVPAGFFDGGTRFRWIYLTVQGDVILGTFESADFGAPPGWSESNDFIPSAFIGIDLLGAVRSLR